MLSKETKNRIEYAFSRYPEWKSYVDARIQATQEQGLTANLTALGGGGGNTSKTEKAICEIESEKKALWCQVIDKTINYFLITDKYDLFVARYIKHKSFYDICDQLHISIATMFIWCRDICEYARGWAIKFGLMEP